MEGEECARRPFGGRLRIKFFPIHAILNQLLKALNDRLFVFLIGNAEPLPFVLGRDQDAVLVSPASIPLTFLNLISVCTFQYAESSLISIMRFVEIRTILVLRLSFAVSKTDEILSLSTGDHTA